jgi:outer membrane murein-binding lipoprotein Lpp
MEGVTDFQLLAFAGAALALVGGAFAAGRRTGRGSARARELEVVVEDLRKDHECALSEHEAARHELKRAQRELDRYRDDVNDHFAGTSELLRELTLQYRAVYDHLAQGAALLCPDDAPALESGFAAGALPPALGDRSAGDGRAARSPAVHDEATAPRP